MDNKIIIIGILIILVAGLGGFSAYLLLNHNTLALNSTVNNTTGTNSVNSTSNNQAGSNGQSTSGSNNQQITPSS